jgi:hypothetical protein
LQDYNGDETSKKRKERKKGRKRRREQNLNEGTNKNKVIRIENKEKHFIRHLGISKYERYLLGFAPYSLV